MTKRILAILLALTLSLTMFALPTFAAETKTVNLASNAEGNVITATWDAATGATSYQVTVYNGGTQIESKTVNSNTYTYTATVSGTYTFEVRAIGTTNYVSYGSASRNVTISQETTANGITFKRDGTTVTVSWSKPAAATGTVSYDVEYSIGSGSKVTLNTDSTSCNITGVPTTSSVTVDVTYRNRAANNTLTSGSVGSATLSASGSVSGNGNSGGTISNPTTGDVTYANGRLYWTTTVACTSFTVTYYYNGSTIPQTDTVATVGVYGTWDVPANVIKATVTGTTATGGTLNIGTWSITGQGTPTSGVTCATGTRTVSWGSVGSGAVYYIYINGSSTALTSTTSTSWTASEGIYNVVIKYTYGQMNGTVGSITLPRTGNYNGTGSSTGSTTTDVTTSNQFTLDGLTVYKGSTYSLVSWGADSASTGYIISYSNAAGTVTKTWAVDKSVTSVQVPFTPSDKWSISVISYRTTGQQKIASITVNPTGSTTTNTSTTTNGTNCTVVSTASSSTVTWTGNGSAYYVVYYTVGSTTKATTVSGKTSCTLPVGNSNAFSVIVADANNSYVALATVAQSTSSSTSNTTAKTEIKNLTLTPKNSYTTTVSWNKSSNASYYLVLYSLYGSSSEETAPVWSATSYDIPFGAGKDYQVYVYAVNASGVRSLVGYATHIASDTSSSSGTTTTTPTGSEYVTGFKGTQNGSNKIRLSWTAAEGATSYTVYWKRSSNTTWKKATTTSKTAVILKGLNNGTSYDFKIVANDKDSSILTMAPSATGNATKTTTDPKTETTVVKVPTITYATSTASGTASVKWTAVTGATSYKVYFAPSGESTYKLKATVTDNGCTVTGLTKGTYKVRVKALVNGTWTELKDCDYESVVVG